MAEPTPTRGRGAWVRALARRMKAWADAILAEETAAVPPRPEPRPPQPASNRASPPPVRADGSGPPEHWLRAVQAGQGGPPADWVARVRKGAPRLLESLAPENGVTSEHGVEDLAPENGVTSERREEEPAPPVPARTPARPVPPGASAQSARVPHAPTVPPGDGSAVRRLEPLSEAAPAPEGPGSSALDLEPVPPASWGPGLDLSRSAPPPPRRLLLEPLAPGPEPRPAPEEAPRLRAPRRPTPPFREERHSARVLRSVPPLSQEERPPTPAPARARPPAHPRVQVLSIDGDTVNVRESWEPPRPRAPALPEERTWEAPSWKSRSEEPALASPEVVSGAPEPHPWPELPPAPQAERTEVLVELRQWERLRRLEREQRGE